MTLELGACSAERWAQGRRHGGDRGRSARERRRRFTPLPRRVPTAAVSAQPDSASKLNNVREAIAICRSARAILGGNGVTLDRLPLRQADNLESVRSYEGTDEVPC
jgi:alkylation response protein AidB-like acyl-CoA dehydrogenase